MLRTYLIFGDIEGKLDVLRVECRKCRRKGRHLVHELIAKYGRKGNKMKWKEQLNGRPSAMRTACTSAATCAAPICRRCCDGLVVASRLQCALALGAGAAVAIAR